MAVSFEKYRILLVIKKLKPVDVHKGAEVAWSVLNRMENDQHVSSSSLDKICKFLDCNFGDLMDYVNESVNYSNDSTNK